MTEAIITPGPSIKKRIHAAVEKIARNPKLIEVLQANEEHKAKFSFLTPGDTFYPYYIHRLQEIKSGGFEGGAGGATRGEADDKPGARKSEGGSREAGGEDEDDDVPSATEDESHHHHNTTTAIKADPHPNQFSISLDMGLEAVPQLELSVILEYVAKELKYGSDFTARFRTSPLISQPIFEFLNPQSSKYALYRNILAVYRRIQSACATPDSLEGMLEQLDLYTDPNYVMRVCNESADAIRAQKEQEAQRVASSSASKFVDYDWQNFIVVEEFSAVSLGIPGPSSAIDGGQQVLAPPPQQHSHQSIGGNGATIGMYGVVPQQPQQIMAFDDTTGELLSLEDAGKHVKAANRALAADNNGGAEVDRQKRPRDDGLATAAESANHLTGGR